MRLRALAFAALCAAAALRAAPPARAQGDAEAAWGGPPAAAAAWANLRPGSVPAWIDAGLERVFELDIDSAEREFHRILRVNPHHPDGHYGMATAAWMRTEYGPSERDPGLEKEFVRRIDTSIEKARAWLKARPGDPEVLMTLGGSYGMKSRWDATRGKWLQAVFDGRRAMAAVRAANKADPRIYDAYLGIGMWEYYADVFPRFIKVLGRMVLGGDRLRGLEHLKLAAEKGRYGKVGAQLVLIEILLEDRFGSRDPELALRMIRKLRAWLPNSPIFHQIEQVCSYEAGEYAETVRTSEEYLSRIDRKVLNYHEAERARAHVSIGMAKWRSGDPAGARAALEQAAALAGDPGSPNRWGLWGLVRLAQLEDATGRREDALRRYRRAQEYADRWGFRPVVKKHLKEPFPKDADPGPLPPPAA